MRSPRPHPCNTSAPLRWHHVAVALFLVLVLVLRGSGLELLIFGKHFPDPNPRTHWEKCKAGLCHCKLAGTCGPHCCCAFREKHPDKVAQSIEKNRFLIRHSCQGKAPHLEAWQPLPKFLIQHHVPEIPWHPQTLQTAKNEPRWKQGVRKEPPEKIPILLSRS
jgi:hypothetical protein